MVSRQIVSASVPVLTCFFFYLLENETTME